MSGILLLLFGLLPEKINIDLQVLNTTLNGLIHFQLQLLNNRLMQRQILRPLLIPFLKFRVVFPLLREVHLDQCP